MNNKLVFGINAVREAIQEPSKIQKILVENGHKNPAAQKLKDEIMRSGVSYSFVPEQKLYKHTKENHQGFVALIGQIQFSELESILDPEKQQFFLLLDGITDVRNFGAIIRSAAGLGASGIVIGQTGSAPLNEIAIQASAGGAFHIPIVRVNHIKDAMYILKSHEIALAGCTEKATSIVSEINLKRSLGIVMGNENKGISKGVLNLCDEQIKIPINDVMDSYNVSVAASLVLYEYHRQNN
ncbi:MAG: Putative TrmH family tRNA/rRNA methyltransferase [Bacteroidetes bacterium MED-G17]|nr:MAG: Putative TrmH family tRNA/rRNA methyltransferase [Bacteroidetes bacterium MED-G17]